ncbi:MAG: OmpH family outer membrane protein [Ignavibacteria bacterium]|nr:OmpH family outer membrane protein [Ignavibacteria bacterium]
MVCIVFLFAGIGLSAQKIGYVSTETIKKQYDPYIQAEARLNVMVEEWKAELSQMKKDIDDLELEMRKNRLIWTDAERQQKELDIADKRRKREEFASEKFAPGGEHDQQAESLFKAIWEKIYLAIQKISAEDGYDIVWDKSVQPLVYVNAKYDITVRVMKQLGIDAESLAKKQQEVIDADPRNKKLEERRQSRTRRRSTSPSDPSQDTVQNPTPDGLAQPRSPSNLPPPMIPMDNPPPPPADTTRPREEEVPR